VAQNLCASPLDAGTTVHGHGTNITFLNATMIETELRESVLGACDAFVAVASAADPPLDTAATAGLIIFVATGCVLMGAFFVYSRSNGDRQMIKKLKDLDDRDLGIENPLYDAPGMAKTNPTFANPDFTSPGYSSAEESSEDDATYAEIPSQGHDGSGGLKQSKDSQAMKRRAKEDFEASLPAGVTATDALEMMFEVKESREAEGGYMEIGAASESLAAGAGSSRKERRASKKAAKKAKKDGAGYFSAAFDSPLGAPPNDGRYGEVDAICDSDNDDREDDDGLYDDYDTVVADKDGDDGIYNEISGPAFENANKSTAPDDEGASSSSEDEWGGFDEGAAGREDDGKQVLMGWD